MVEDSLIYDVNLQIKYYIEQEGFFTKHWVSMM